MPKRITLKSIPDEVYERLKAEPAAHRRSLNSKAIVCLETVLLLREMPSTERLARARALRASLPQGKSLASDIDELKNERRL